MRIRYYGDPSLEDFLSWVGTPSERDHTKNGQIYVPERTAVRNFMSRCSNINEVRCAAVSRYEFIDFGQALIIMRAKFYEFIYKFESRENFICHADNWHNEQVAKAVSALRERDEHALGALLKQQNRIKSTMAKEMLKYDHIYSNKIEEVCTERYRL